jgi:hypothetical protein
MPNSGQAVMENVRRCRAIASLYRQTAAFRPDQSWSLLRQAEEWEQLALTELEAYFDARNNAGYGPQPYLAAYVNAMEHDRRAYC